MHLPAWGLAIALLVAAGYAVPYLLLSGVEAWTGAFLFWVAFGGAVWLVLVLRIARWNVGANPSPRGEERR